MTERLIDKFIKKIPENEEERKQYALTAFAVAAAVHLFMFAVKMICGVLARSVAVRADAWNNFASALAAVFGIFSFRALEDTRRIPKDGGRDDRRKGIRKVRYIAAFIAAFIVFEIGFSLFSRAFTRLRHPAPVTHGIPAALLLVFCSLLRHAFGVYYVRISGKLDMRLLPGYVRHARAANIRTGLAAAAVVLDQYVHINADFLVTLLLSAAVMREGIMIAVQTIRPAVEEEPDQGLVRDIRKRLREYSLVQGIGSLKVRFFGPGMRMIAMRIKVPKAADMAEIFGNIRVIEETVGKEFGIALVLHADPIESSDRESLKVRRILEEELEARDERLSFDHFHIVRGKEFSNLIFDLFVPFEYEEEKTRILMEEIGEKMRLVDARYLCVISPRKLT